MQMAGQALGMPMQIAGAFLGASAADRRKKYIEKIAATPGVDLTKVNQDTLTANQGSLGAAQKYASAVNMGSMEDLNAILETAIPGYSPMQRSRADAVAAMVRGEIPQDVTNQVFRNSAARSLEGGYAGSGAARNLTARDLGMTSLDIIGRGMTGMESLIRSTPMPRMLQANDVLNLNPLATQGLRSKERTEMMDMYLTAAQAPGSQDVWSKTLTDMGSQMASSGGGGGGGDMMGGMLGGIMGMI